LKTLRAEWLLITAYGPIDADIMAKAIVLAKAVEAVLVRSEGTLSKGCLAGWL
jgi:hypothetical protein